MYLGANKDGRNNQIVRLPRCFAEPPIPWSSFPVQWNSSCVGNKFEGLMGIVPAIEIDAFGFRDGRCSRFSVFAGWAFNRDFRVGDDYMGVVDD